MFVSVPFLFATGVEVRTAHSGHHLFQLQEPFRVEDLLVLLTWFHNSETTFETDFLKMDPVLKTLLLEKAAVKFHVRLLRALLPNEIPCDCVLYQQIYDTRLTRGGPTARSVLRTNECSILVSFRTKLLFLYRLS